MPEEIEIKLDQAVNSERDGEEKTDSDTNLTESSKEPVESKPEIKAKFVDFKQITELTDEERQIIINNAKAGVDQNYYDVRFYKNGKIRIIKKKSKPQTVSQKVLQTSTSKVDKPDKVYYSDNQLLMEHIIELNSKYDKLYSKHKKLKKKYYNLRDDIYYDESPDSQPEQKNEADKPEATEPSETNEQPNTNPYLRNDIRPQRVNWRSQFRYL